MEHARTKGGVHVKRYFMQSHILQLCVLLRMMNEHSQQSMSWMRSATLLLTGNICMMCASHRLPSSQGQFPCGVCSATQANKYSQEQLRLMKGQDIKHLALKSQAEAKVA